MAEFSRVMITGQGHALIAKLIAGTGSIEFTKICASSAEYTLGELEPLTELSDIKQTSVVSKVFCINDVSVQVEAAFTNTELKEGYFMRTLGLYAVDPDVGEILYAATVEVSGSCYMPPYNGIAVSGAYIQLVTTVGSAENVTLEVDAAAVATIGDIKALRKEIEEQLAKVQDQMKDKTIGYDEEEQALIWSGGVSSGGVGIGGYTLPVASTTRLGGVKIGSGIAIDEDGTIRVDPSSLTKEDAEAIVKAGTKEITAEEVAELYEQDD